MTLSSRHQASRLRTSTRKGLKSLRRPTFSSASSMRSGIPCFDIMEDIKPESIVVYELSAHQLEYVHNSPRVGVLLNIFEEHLDHFGSMQRYAGAKLNIMRYMGEDDTAVIHETLMEEAWSLFVNNIVFSLFYIDELVDRTALPLLGEHNLMNVKAALLACYAYGVDIRELVPYLYTFKPLEHRLRQR